MCGAMDLTGSYDFGAAFAQLTGVLEDAAAVACAGQAAGIEAARYEDLIADLLTHFGHAERLLEKLDTELQ